MLNKAQKKQVVEEFAADLKGVKGLVLGGYQGVEAREIQRLRGELKKQGVGYKVVKLTLLKRVLETLGVDTASFNYSVPVSVSYSAEDEALPAKLLKDFAKKQDKFKLLGGVLDGALISQEQVKALASLPGKQELRGQLVGVIAGPLRGLVSVLSGNIRGFINVLNAKSKLTS